MVIPMRIPCDDLPFHRVYPEQGIGIRIVQQLRVWAAALMPQPFQALDTAWTATRQQE